MRKGTILFLWHSCFYRVNTVSIPCHCRFMMLKRRADVFTMCSVILFERIWYGMSVTYDTAFHFIWHAVSNDLIRHASKIWDDFQVCLTHSINYLTKQTSKIGDAISIIFIKDLLVKKMLALVVTREYIFFYKIKKLISNWVFIFHKIVKLFGLSNYEKMSTFS